MCDEGRPAWRFWMDKLTKFVKEQSLQRSERSARVEEQVQWLIDLGSRGEKTAADFGLASNVANLARDHNDEVAAAAIRALGDFGKEGAKHMSAVATGLNRSGEVCVAAATALAQFGPAALPYSEQLATCLHRPSDEASKAAVLAALGALRATQHNNVLVEFLEDKSMAVAAAACQALGKLGAAGAPEASRIAQKMKHPGTRFAAVTALGNLGPEVVKKNLPEIVSCLQDKDSLTRQAAASTLAVAPDAVLADPKSIVALLKDSQPGLRCAAALALGKCGASSAAEDVAVLLGDNGDDDSESYLAVGGGSLRSAYILRRPKCAALMSLSLMKSEKHLAAVSGALRDKSYEVRLCAIEALMQFGAAAKKHFTSIMSVLEDDVYLVRLKACQCIAAIGATDVIDNLPDLFHDEAPSVRQAALDALATYPDHAKTYSSQVFKCISDEYGCVRASAMRCLASMETVGQCYASTIAGELASQDPESRAAACETLGKLGDYGAAFAEDIEMWQSDEIPMVRAAAGYALVQLGAKVAPSLENGSL